MDLCSVQGPGAVAHHGGLLRGGEDVHEGLQTAVLQDHVAEVGRVSGDVAQGPHGLLAHVLVWKGIVGDSHPTCGINVRVGLICGSGL